MSLAEETRRLRAVPTAPPPRLPCPRLLPPEQLAELLLHYRQYNVHFDTGWELAYEQIAWPDSRRDASEWRTAIKGTREGWRAAYLRWPAEPREEACAQLERVLAAVLREDEDYELDAAAGF